jgi:hypothetical protein
MLATLLTGADAGNGPISYLGGLIHRHTSVLFTLGVGRVTLQVKGCLRTRDRLSAALVVRTGAHCLHAQIVSIVDDNEAVRIANAILIPSLGSQAHVFASAEEFLITDRSRRRGV